MKIALVVNGASVSRDVEPRQNLVDFLREGLQLTGSHVGCEHGVCGACTVRVDGALVRGCLMLAVQADGCRVETIEGVAGRGTYTDDVVVPRLAHAAFVRSPHAHARIVSIEVAEAKALPGVIAVVTGRELSAYCEPWVGVLKSYASMKSPPQYPLALDKAVWQGEPVVAVVAESRALAEDGCDRVRVTWEPLVPVVDAESALAAGAPLIHPEP